MGLVIDTSALAHLERSKKSTPLFSIADEPLVLPVIVWAEALIGVRLANSPERAAQRRGLLERIRMLTGLEPFSPDAAEIFADVYCRLRKAGLTVPQNDLQIAATALSLDFGVLIGPRDERHFRQIEGLRIELLE